MSENDDNFGSFLAGFLVGGIIGGVAALLFAPQTGEETRKQVKEKSIELGNKVAKYADEVVTQTEKVAGDASKKTSQFINTTVQKAAEVAEKGQVVLEKKKGKTSPAKKAAKSE